MSWQKSHEVHQKQVLIAPPRKEWPHGPVYVGSHPAGEQLGGKGSGDPDGHEVGREPATWWVEGGKWLIVFWAALEKVLPADQGMWSFPSTEQWWGHIWSAVSTSGSESQNIELEGICKDHQDSSVEKRYGHMRDSPTKGHNDDGDDELEHPPCGEHLRERLFSLDKRLRRSYQCV